MERGETSAATLASGTMPNGAPDAQARDAAASRDSSAAAAKPVRPQDAMESATTPEPAKAAAVRDMKFEVTGGEQRIEVRLSERAGEVKMTVRTADEPLASALRENLPALSARLAESGFKSEAWRPPASSTNEWRHGADVSARGASTGSNQDANPQSRDQGREPRDGDGQRRPKISQEQTPPKEKGSKFAWLMSSLR
jgi:hypothetical protein